MQKEAATIVQGKTSLLPPKKKDHEQLRRSYSEIPIDSNTDKLFMITGKPAGAHKGCTRSSTGARAAAGSDVETVRCACCGVPEDCTAAYIHRIRAVFCGSWVCGLCAEAVTERMRRGPAGGGVEEALGSHMAVCRDFNGTTRLNPKLSLAGSMRDIARRSFEYRRTSPSCHGHLRASSAAAIERSISNHSFFT